MAHPYRHGVCDGRVLQETLAERKAARQSEKDSLAKVLGLSLNTKGSLAGSKFIHLPDVRQPHHDNEPPSHSGYHPG